MDEKWWKNAIKELEDMSDEEFIKAILAVAHVGDEYFYPEYPYEEIKDENSST